MAPRPIDILPGFLVRLLRPVQGHALFEPVGFVLRLGWLFYKQLQEDRAFVRAAGMAYATLMALVPSLVLVFGLLGTLGILQDPNDQEAVYDALFGTFFGDIVEIRDALTPFLSNVDFGALGVVSTIVLLVVAARLFLMVERAYSDIFEVPVDRNMGKRILNFYFALTAVPVVMVVTIEGAWQFGVFQRPFVLFLQFALILGALKFFPCTHVRWAPALIGATTSWVLLGIGGRLTTYYIQWSYADPSYNLRAFYGSLILVPIFLLWLYVVWLILLLGVEVAHLAQNYGSLMEAELEAAERRRGMRAPTFEAALEVLARVALRFDDGGGVTTLEDLRDRIKISNWHLVDITEALTAAGYLLRVEEGWVLARPAERILLQEVAEGWRDETRVRGHRSIVADLAPSYPGTLADGLRRWALDR
jgi:membrane protein